MKQTVHMIIGASVRFSLGFYYDTMEDIRLQTLTTISDPRERQNNFPDAITGHVDMVFNFHHS